MDRDKSRPLKALACVVALAIDGSGCSRLKTYRSQDSPLPLARLGWPASDENRAARQLGREADRVDPVVAWSGKPNLSAPLMALATPKPPAEAATSAKIPDAGLADVEALVKSGRAEFAKMASYQVDIHRQERAGGALQPAEDVVLSIRTEPRAVRLEWPEGPHKGREVLYSPRETGGMMHIHMADSLIPVPDLSLAPDSPMVLSHSRHPITEAGLDALLERLEGQLQARSPGDDSITDAGVTTPPEVGRPCRKVVRKTPTSETWAIFLDAQTGIPAMVHEMALDGQLLELDVFRDLKPNPPVLADASAFDPSSRWGQAKGFFGRLAGGTPPAAVPESARR